MPIGNFWWPDNSTFVYNLVVRFDVKIWQIGNGRDQIFMTFEIDFWGGHTFKWIPSVNRAAGDEPYASLKKRIAGTDTVWRFEISWKGSNLISRLNLHPVKFVTAFWDSISICPSLLFQPSNSGFVHWVDKLARWSWKERGRLENYCGTAFRIQNVCLTLRAGDAIKCPANEHVRSKLLPAAGR